MFHLQHVVLLITLPGKYRANQYIKYVIEHRHESDIVNLTQTFICEKAVFVVEQFD